MSSQTLPKTMLAVVKDKPAKGVSVKQVPVPKPKKGEILVKVLGASICGTDIGIYDWIPWAADNIKPPTIIGHEVVGEVVEINGDPSDAPKKLKVGDIVSSETHIFDDACHQCDIDNKHICENMDLFGIGRNGGFAEYATIPIRTSWKNVAPVPVEAMSVQEPLGNAVHVVHKADVKGKRVLVVGLGPTGLCAAAAAVAYGAKEVVAVDPQDYRRTLMKKFSSKVKTQSSLKKSQDSYFDAVCEMSGHPAGIQSAFDAVRIGGKIIAFGIPKSTVEVDWGKYMINKELTIESVFGRRIWETWEQTTKLLKSGKVDLTKIITHTFPLAEFEKAMEVMKSGKCGKIVLKA